MWAHPGSSKPSRGSHKQQNTNTKGKIWQAPKSTEIAKMAKQRNKSQMKEQENSIKEEINEMQLSKFSEVEFRAMILRKLSSMNKNTDMLKINQMEIKNHQEKIKNNISKIKNTLEGINSRVEEAEDQINELEDRVGKINQSEPKGKNNLKK
uniref:Uncharacterized protein n=1 Tax=Molossus molossus TaxID=27622 RepID=A0A7J8ERM4_MOLMO|nr:hypothetical protein HJG59_008750 [Molossus molossus]